MAIPEIESGPGRLNGLFTHLHVTIGLYIYSHTLTAIDLIHPHAKDVLFTAILYLRCLQIIKLWILWGKTFQTNQTYGGQAKAFYFWAEE